ncbi:multidrug transport mfs family [Qipengyuania citrea LAMA 915]|uniref:Multidrug transport mfs family n=1 Tax=Qipengyuania citrea LAMA 915 TaxID=1306953 RepID=A0A0L1KID3_9SPHN|nr:multidrug transport mfs family [Qipengyuania citrea LAMA 915]
MFTRAADGNFGECHEGNVFPNCSLGSRAGTGRTQGRPQWCRECGFAGAIYNAADRLQRAAGTDRLSNHCHNRATGRGTVVAGYYMVIFALEFVNQLALCRSARDARDTKGRTIVHR